LLSLLPSGANITRERFAKTERRCVALDQPGKKPRETAASEKKRGKERDRERERERERARRRNAIEHG